MISSRYAWPVIVLLLIALVPTVIHSYLGLEQDYGTSASKINSTLDDFNAMPSKRNSGWGKETFDSYDWVERIYNNAQGKSIRLFIGKSYDHKRLYHHPELALSHGKDLSSNGKALLTSPLNINVTLLKSNTQLGITAYALLYDGQFIDNPIIHSLNNALYLLTHAKKPLILFYVSDETQPNNIPFNNTIAADLLQKSIADFLKTP